MLRPGVTTAEIDAAVERFFAEHQAEPLFKGVPGHGPLSRRHLHLDQRRSGPRHPRHAELIEGDIVSIDTGCKLNGWCGDAAATYAVGRVDPEVRRLLDVTRQRSNLAIELMGQRKWWSEVAGKWRPTSRSTGFSVVEAFVGHGIGREDARRPPGAELRQPPASAAAGDFRLVPGLVIAVEPMVNMGTKEVRMPADHWTQVTADGRPSAHFEHTIAITEAGPLVLTAGPNGETW